MKSTSKVMTALAGLFLGISFTSNAQWTTSGTNIYNTNTGNVGIGSGTAFTPTEKLDIMGNIRLNNNTIYFRGSGDNNHGLAYRGANPFASQSIDGPVLFGWSGGVLGTTASAEKIVLRWSFNGNVGIGTPGAPLEALQIGDRFTLHNGGYKGIAYNFTYGSSGDTRINADYATGLFFTNVGTILFRTAPSGTAGSAITWQNVMTINNNGKVLIGDPNLTNFKGIPGSYLLYVQQGILTEKLKVAVATTNDWSDYVFTKNYQLKSISELESFIKENKHLPNVPAAEEVVKEGIDVAKMDAKLLEKIEELSLYIIQQNKRIEKLEAQLQK